MLVISIDSLLRKGLESGQVDLSLMLSEVSLLILFLWGRLGFGIEYSCYLIKCSKIWKSSAGTSYRLGKQNIMSATSCMGKSLSTKKIEQVGLRLAC